MAEGARQRRQQQERLETEHQAALEALTRDKWECLLPLPWPVAGTHDSIWGASAFLSSSKQGSSWPASLWWGRGGGVRRQAVGALQGAVSDTGSVATNWLCTELWQRPTAPGLKPPVVPCRRAAATLLKTATEKMMAAQEQARQAEEGAASLQQRQYNFEQQVSWFRKTWVRANAWE